MFKGLTLFICEDLVMKSYKTKIEFLQNFFGKSEP